MKLQKLIPVISAAVMLSACAEIPPVKETVPEEQQMTITPPEDGWTAEELMSVTYIDGLQLEYPLTLRSFGAGACVSDVMWSGEDENDRAYSITDARDSNAAMLGTTLASVRFGKKYSQITADDPMTEIIFFGFGVGFSVNGIKNGSSSDDVKKAFGEPDMITENGDIQEIFSYDNENGDVLMSVILNNDKVFRIDVEL